MGALRSAGRGEVGVMWGRGVEVVSIEHEDEQGDIDFHGLYVQKNRLYDKNKNGL